MSILPLLMTLSIRAVSEAVIPMDGSFVLSYSSTVMLPLEFFSTSSLKSFEATPLGSWAPVEYPSLIVVAGKIALAAKSAVTIESKTFFIVVLL